MSGTELSWYYQPQCVVVPAYARDVRCPHTHWYAVSGMDVACGGTSLRACYAKSGTEIAYARAEIRGNRLVLETEGTIFCRTQTRAPNLTENCTIVSPQTVVYLTSQDALCYVDAGSLLAAILTPAVAGGMWFQGMQPGDVEERDNEVPP
eukprot:2772610-Rhodomonas_salina.1